MSVQLIWRAQWHFEMPLAIPPGPIAFATQMQVINGPQIANVIAAASDPATIGAALDANGLTTPAGSTRVFELIAPAATPQAYQ